jgi:hypothetical protein
VLSKERRKEYQREWRAKNKDKQVAYRRSDKFKRAEANRHLVRTYGITVEDKQRMWESQNGLCSVCNKPLPDTFQRDCQVEHCHTTGRVRSLAHWYCNVIVGVMENHPTLLHDVESYLDLHNGDAIVRPYGKNKP